MHDVVNNNYSCKNIILINGFILTTGQVKVTLHIFARFTNVVNYNKKILVLCFKTFLRPRDDDRRHIARNTMQIKMQRNAKFQGKKNFGFLEYKCNELQKSSSSVWRHFSDLEWAILHIFANTKSQKSNSINCTGDQVMINQYVTISFVDQFIFASTEMVQFFCRGFSMPNGSNTWRSE